MTDKEILEQLRALLTPEEKWYNGKRKSNKFNSICLLSGLHALGAGRSKARDKLEELAGEDIVDFNDTHSYSEVIGLIDKTIEIVQCQKTHYIDLEPHYDYLGNKSSALYSSCGRNDRAYKLKFTSRGKKVEATCLICKKIENKDNKLHEFSLAD
jgi:hypothetical protein